MNNAPSREFGVCIRGVTSACTNEALEGAFAQFGAITDTFVKAERGYAFVTFAEKASVAAALAGAPSTVGSDNVTVEARSEARPRKEAPPSCNVYIKGLAATTAEAAVSAVAGDFGSISTIQVEAERGFAFVGFESEEAAAAMVNAGPLAIDGAQTTVEFRLSKPRQPRAERGAGEEKGERPRRARKPRKRDPIAPNSVYLKGVPKDCSDEDIVAALAGAGTVVSVAHRPGRDFAFAVMETPEAMNAAVGSATVGGAPCNVEVRTGGKSADGPADPQTAQE